MSGEGLWDGLAGLKIKKLMHFLKSILAPVVGASMGISMTT